MAYKKKFSKSKKSTKVTKSVKQYVKRTLNARIEDKYVDNTWASQVPTYSYANISQMTNPSQGTALSQRIGDKIRPMKIQVRGQIYGPNTHVIRLIFFRWHPNSVPSGADILDNAYVSTFRAIFAPYEDTTKPMYTILKDKTMALSAYGKNSIPFKFTIGKKKLANIEFTAGSILAGTNLIYVLMVQDGLVSLNTLDMVARLWYEDA